MSRVLGRVLLGAGALAVALLGGQQAAHAGAGTGGSGSDGSFTVSASVTFSGDGAPGGGGVVVMGVPATCYWVVDTSVPRADEAAVTAWYGERYASNAGGSFAGQIGMYGPLERYQDVARRQAAGEDISWYKANCRTDDLDVVADFTGETYNWGGAVPVFWQNFPTGAEPEPLVDPEDLAELAWDHMELVAPEVGRNPVSEIGGSTFVGLDTWFWVEDPEAVGGADGTRTIRAQVQDVWAEVTATTGGLTVSSPAGSAQCTVAQAQSRDGACSVVFRRASVGYEGGFPVEASAVWQAAWTSSTGAGGALGAQTEDADVVVPVAESQAVVRRS